MDMDKVVERIRKLRGLAQSSNVHEAAAAAAEAQRLMTEHRIEEASIQVGKEDEPVSAEDVLQHMGRRLALGWERVLLNGVARANGCRTILYHCQRGYGVKGRFDIVGRKRDIDAVRYLFMMLRGEIERLADAWERDNVYDGMPLAKQAKTNFKLGAATEIQSRMREQASAQERSLKTAGDMGHAGASTALVVLNRAALAADDFVKRECGFKDKKGNVKFRTVGGPKIDNVRAFRDGQEAGRSVELGGRHRAVGPAPRQIGGGR